VVIRRRQEVDGEEAAPPMAHYRDVLFTVEAAGEVQETTERVPMRLHSD
jgi:adenylate kinase family enzyme